MIRESNIGFYNVIILKFHFPDFGFWRVSSIASNQFRNPFKADRKLLIIIIIGSFIIKDFKEDETKKLLFILNRITIILVDPAG